MLQFDAQILGNRELAPGWKELVLRWNGAAGHPHAGEFLTLRVSSALDPLLRRPFAFASFHEDPDGASRAGILYQVRGKATRILADLGTGAFVDVLGPLGRGFPDAAQLEAEGSRPLLVAGGVGLGPILFLAAQLEAARIPASAAGPALIVAGFRNSAAIPRAGFPAGTVTCTDDGSSGYRGTVLDYLSRELPPGNWRLMACGPAPMLAAVATLARARSWEASLCAEQWMACGVGACMGCALPVPGGASFLRACVDGPVFGRDDIDWGKEGGGR